MFKHYIKSLPSQLIYNINMYKHGNKFGNLNFVVLQNQAILNNIEVNETGQGNGSELLKHFESHVKNIYNVNQVSLLAWQEAGCSNVLNFFEKHGYKYIENKYVNTQTFDDSIKIYDLHKMFKTFE